MSHKNEDGDGDGDGNDEAGDERGAPVAQEEEEDDAGEHEADEDGVANALDAFADESRLVVEGLELDAGGQLGAELRDLSRDAVGDGDGVAGGLARDVEQDCRLAVGGDEGVDRHGGCDDVGDVGDAHGSAACGGLDGELLEAVDVVRLGADEPRTS